MDLIKIDYNHRLLPESKGENKGFICEGRYTIESFQESINRRVAGLQELGMTHFILEFSAYAEDDEHRTFVKVLGTRMEMDEELKRRIEYQEKQNQLQIRAHHEKVDNSKRMKEIRRLTDHLTIEQLQALSKL